jgi:hypothetical protein
MLKIGIMAGTTNSGRSSEAAAKCMTKLPVSSISLYGRQKCET